MSSLDRVFVVIFRSQNLVLQQKCEGSLAIPIVGTPWPASMRTVCNPVVLSRPTTTARGFLALSIDGKARAPVSYLLKISLENKLRSVHVV